MKTKTRKNFILAGIGLAVIALGGIFKFRQKKTVSTVKFLGTDGKLVEVDVDKLPSNRRMASKDEVIHWINPKQL